ncbi:MAG: hypothetical protein ABII90_10385 [Bacteroidota bacterium]
MIANFSKNKNVYLLFAILGILSISFYKDTINLFPSYIHAWTQSDRYALALGFIDNGFDFFHPCSYNLKTVNGITSVDFPIHEYIIAVIMKITGSTAPLIFRIYILLYGLTGLSLILVF